MKELLQGFFDLFEKVKTKMDTLSALFLTKYTELADSVLAKHEALAAVVAAQGARLAELQAAEDARAKAEEAKAKEDALVKQCLSRILFNQSFGGSLANYCEERGWSGITVYVEERYWVLADPVFVGFREKRKPLVKQWVAEKDFLYNTHGVLCYGGFRAAVLGTQKFSQKDIIFILKPLPDANLVNKFIEMGAAKENVFELETLLRQTYQYFIFEKPLLNIQARHPDVQVVLVRLNQVFPNADLTANEKNIVANNIGHSLVVRAELVKNKKRISISWDEFGYSDEDIVEVLTPPPSYYDENKVFSLKDVKGKLVNTRNGNRLTTDVPEDAKRKIFIMGQCVTFGYGCPDKWTMQSWLQRLLNERAPEEKFEVVNVARYIAGWYDSFKNMLYNLPAKDNDIVFVNYLRGDYHTIYDSVVLKAPIIDLKDCFKKPYKYGDVWIDRGHYGPHGQHMVADALFAFLQQHDYFKRDRSPPPETILLYLVGLVVADWCLEVILRNPMVILSNPVVILNLFQNLTLASRRCRNKFRMTVTELGMTVTVVSMRRSYPHTKRFWRTHGTGSTQRLALSS